MAINDSIPVVSDDIQVIIRKTTELKAVFLEKFLSRLGKFDSDTKAVAEDIFNAFSGYSTPTTVSKIVRGVVCRPKYDELPINIQLFEDMFEETFIELGLAEKVLIPPSYKGVDLNFDHKNCYTSVKENVYLFNPETATSLHIDKFINKLKEKIGEDLCKEILLEAKLETAQTMISQKNTQII
ncbi:hypothetical protein OTK49_02975 [Vibrio coralliirubri]|uniref:hypothetical protein n=1 Tax=Vibrio coralliirubri TaxID=1516159 RepID=UPI002283C259|nr:hypothetical protein [Vibrio coralliirubri]MCY9861478.1 hypothetical protein [Vibrio coralliirubri]